MQNVTTLKLEMSKIIYRYQQTLLSLQLSLSQDEIVDLMKLSFAISPYPLKDFIDGDIQSYIYSKQLSLSSYLVAGIMVLRAMPVKERTT